MILSASRRTDIPAFFGEWFINRLHAGELLVRNPMNFNHISKIKLAPESVECIAFWTKNPEPFLKYLKDMDNLGYKYYFLFTLNPYNKTLEVGVDDKENIINTFKQLAEQVSPKKVIWRYDPIILTDIFDKEYHFKAFEYLAKQLHPFTERCTISFLDFYKKIDKITKSINASPPDITLVNEIAEKFSSIANKYSLQLFCCSEKIDLDIYGIQRSKCIDNTLISEIVGHPVTSRKDQTQRKECGCVESKDIGSYNTCAHNCIYCYANSTPQSVVKNCLKYDPLSPMLCDSIRGDEKIVEYKERKFKLIPQDSLF
ncbi:MAG: DUF1848 domain-containing protein [Desulfuromonadales bacterium]|nr:DUF1848 domain-containing protein [Desulfuromonadales bacterium]